MRNNAHHNAQHNTENIMDIMQSLFEGQRIRLAPIDHEKDPEVAARWTCDPAYLRDLGLGAARPLSAAQLKKKYEALEKDMDESHNLFHFAVRSLPGQDGEESRLLGFASISWIEWAHGSGNLQVAIGDRRERGKGYGSQALNLLLRYAFAELNLFRVSAVVGASNLPALCISQKFGFVEEARRRKALLRDGQTYDLLHLGLLRQEWLEHQTLATAQ